MTYDASLGYDDAMPDSFDKWIEQLDADEWIELMDKFQEYTIKSYSNTSIQEAEAWVFDYFAEHVYPDMGAVDGDALYEQQRDAQNDN